MDGLKGTSSSVLREYSPGVVLRAKKLHRPNLSIDTRAGYLGLGVAIPSHGPDHHNEPSLMLRSAKVTRSPTSASSVSALPIVRNPLASHSVLQVSLSSFVEMETAPHFTPAPDHASACAYYDCADDSDNRRHQHRGVYPAVLRVIDNTVVHIADQLARTFHGQIEGAEAGLLLPVREDERENDRAVVGATIG